jgi:TorA maturation chaperone TorD
VGRGELLPYASFYLTGSLYGLPLSALRERLQSLGIGRIASLKEPEDHGGVLCEIMAGLVNRTLAAPPNASQEFFVEHVA